MVCDRKCGPSVPSIGSCLKSKGPIYFPGAYLAQRFASNFPVDQEEWLMKRVFRCNMHWDHLGHGSRIDFTQAACVYSVTGFNCPLLAGAKIVLSVPFLHA